MAEGRTEAELEELDTAIGMHEGAEAEALQALREHQEALGMVFENPDAVVTPELGMADEEYR
jgi:hypothetical protein